MLLRSLTPSVILLAAGFQTASALVMAVAGTLPIKFYTDHRNGGALSWTHRDNHLGGRYTLLQKPEGEFQIHTDESIRNAPGLDLQWEDIENHLYFELSALSPSGSQGRVYCRQPQTSDDPGPGIQETSSSMPVIGRDGKKWGKITYTAIKNKTDRTGSSYVKATVDSLPVVFYKHPDGRLRFLNKPYGQQLYWADGDIIVPLNATIHFYVDNPEENGSRRVYQSPIDNDPSWKDIHENLYVAKADFEVEADFCIGDVIDGAEMDDDQLRNYLKVKFGVEGSPFKVDDKILSSQGDGGELDDIQLLDHPKMDFGGEGSRFKVDDQILSLHGGSTPAGLAQQKQTSSPFGRKWCCAGSKVVE